MSSVGDVLAGGATVALKANSATLDAGLASAQAKLKAWGSKAQSTISGYFSGMGGMVLGGLGLTGGVAGIGMLVKGFADAGDAAEDLGYATGLSAEAWSKFSSAAKLVGIEGETLATMFGRINNKIQEARDGNAGAITDFSKLGLNFRELADLSIEGQFFKIADAISKLQNPSERAAAAISMFGKSGLDMLQFLDKGAAGIAELEEKAESLGMVMDKDTIAKAKEADLAIKSLTGTFIGLRNTIATSIGPTISAMIEGWIALIKDVKELVGGVSDKYPEIKMPTMESQAEREKIIQERIDRLYLQRNEAEERLKQIQEEGKGLSNFQRSGVFGFGGAWGKKRDTQIDFMRELGTELARLEKEKMELGTRPEEAVAKDYSKRGSLFDLYEGLLGKGKAEFSELKLLASSKLIDAKIAWAFQGPDMKKMAERYKKDQEQKEEEMRLRTEDIAYRSAKDDELAALQQQLSDAEAKSEKFTSQGRFGDIRGMEVMNTQNEKQTELLEKINGVLEEINEKDEGL